MPDWMMFVKKVVLDGEHPSSSSAMMRTGMTVLPLTSTKYNSKIISKIINKIN